MSDISKLLAMFKERDILKAMSNTLIVVGTPSSVEEMTITDQIEALCDKPGMSDETNHDLRLRLMMSILKEKGKEE